MYFNTPSEVRNDPERKGLRIITSYGADAATIIAAFRQEVSKDTKSF